MTSILKTHAMLLTGCIALLCYTLISLCVWPDTLYWSYDGDCYINWTHQLSQYASSPIDHSVISPLQGMGGLIEPNGAWIDPALLPLCIDNGLVDARIASYLIAIALAALSTYALGRGVGLSKPISLVGAQLISVFFFPPVIAFLGQITVLPLYMLGAQLSIPASLATLFVAAFIRIGVTATMGSVAAIVSLPLLVLYSVLCSPLWTTMMFLPAGLFTCGILLASPSGKVFRTRLLGLVICLAVLLSCNLQNYYRAMLGYTARQAFPNEIAGEVQQFDGFTAFVFQNAFAATIVFLLVISCFVTFLLGSRQQLGFAASVLLVLIVVIGLSLVYVYSGMRWNKPLPCYIEFGALPGYIVGFLLGLSVGWQRLRATSTPGSLPASLSTTDRRHSLLGFSAVLMVPGSAAICLIAFGQESLVQHKYEREMQPIFRYLVPQLAISSGGSFRGSVVTVAGVPGGPLARKFGYPDYAPGGLGSPIGLVEYWKQQIPTLEDYSCLVTPPCYFLFSRALARPQDYQLKNALSVTAVRPKLLGGLGAKFLLTDMEFQDPLLSPLPVETKVLGVTLRLYEITETNTASHAPVNTHCASTAAEALDLMLSDRFSFRHDVVLFESIKLQSPLVDVEGAQMAFERGGVRVQATSSGQSLLVLPIQFSHSLRIICSPDDLSLAQPRLLRANLAQTAVLFRNQIDIRITNTFGLFRDIQGRFRDIQDCQRLSIVEDGTVPYPAYHQPHAILPHLW